MMACENVLFQELKQNKSAKNVVENSLSAKKQNQQQIIAEAEQHMSKDHQAHLDFELRRFKRRRLLQYHQLEQNLLHEVSLMWFGFDSLAL
ncbi:unnamed protein product [Soboliphyme baturini]|uniref:Uncharacterized protein n=1 Tax=Soboliphyme baturini TaxID=241478 RepID=A0A183I9I1_9BILA|nr:unnamed protein product [Soboliphyme baturini]